MKTEVWEECLNTLRSEGDLGAKLWRNLNALWQEEIHESVFIMKTLLIFFFDLATHAVGAYGTIDFILVLKFVITTTIKM